MLKCKEYITFNGSMKILLINKYSYLETSIWLYKPDVECWYCNSILYPKNKCEIVIDNIK